MKLFLRLIHKNACSIELADFNIELELNIKRQWGYCTASDNI